MSTSVWKEAFETHAAGVQARSTLSAYGSASQPQIGHKALVLQPHFRVG